MTLNIHSRSDITSRPPKI